MRPTGTESENPSDNTDNNNVYFIKAQYPIKCIKRFARLVT